MPVIRAITKIVVEDDTGLEHSRTAVAWVLLRTRRTPGTHGSLRRQLMQGAVGLRRVYEHLLSALRRACRARRP